MGRSGQRHDPMRFWIMAQDQVTKDWVRAMRGLGEAPGPRVWTDTIEVWQQSVTQVLDLQAAWVRRWTEALPVPGGAAEQLRAQIQQGQDMLQRWTDVQKELWAAWFALLKKLDPVMDSRGVTPAGQTMVQVWREEMQRLIDMQAEWAGHATTSAVEADRDTTDDAAGRPEATPAEHFDGERTGTPTQEATGGDEMASSGEGQEDRRRPDASAGEQPVEPWGSRSRPAHGYPTSPGREELIHAIMHAAKTDAEQATRAVDVILDRITTALAQGEEVRLPGFGSFKVIQTQARVGRNPRTHEPIAIPRGRKAVFRPGSDLRKAIAMAG